MDVRLLKLLSLSLLSVFATNDTVQAADFQRLDHAVPRGGNTEKYAPVFDFDGDGCLPSAGISRNGIQNPGLRTTGSITGQCRSPNFLVTSNTLHRYACITSGGVNYCGHFYSLYFEKDQCYEAQALPDPVCGHRHDWEHAAVWTINGVITHGGVSAHGDLESKPIAQLPREGDHFKVVYHKDASGGGTHALRFAKNNEYAENPYGMFVTPVQTSWYELSGDGPSNEQMRWNLNNFCYGCCAGWPDDVCGGTIPLMDTYDTFLNNLNQYKPPGYPAFTQAGIAAANPNNPVLEIISGGDGTFTADGTNYSFDFGQVHIPLIGDRLLSAEFMVINQVSEPADRLDGYFDMSAAAPFLTTGFDEFTDLAAGDFFDGLFVEISTAGYGPSLIVGDIKFQPKGLVDTGARELLDPITLNMSLELAPPVDDIVAELPDSSIRTKGNRTALWNFLQHARANAQSGNMDQAKRMLQKALERTDGCVLRGAPDTQADAPLAKDYIVNCTDQELIYALINEELDAIAGNSGAGAISFNAPPIAAALSPPPPGQSSNASGGGSFGLFALASLIAAVITKKII